jgi:anti-anti-sigma factor
MGAGVEASVSTRRRGGILTLAVSGDMDLSSGALVANAINDAIGASGVSLVQVDLSAVEFLDSFAIALLLKGRRRADAQGIGYLVTNAHGIARQVLELTGVWEHLSGEAGRDRPAVT